MIGLTLAGAPQLRAQDAATTERLEKLSGTVKDLLDSREAFQQSLQSLQKDLRDLQDKVNSGNSTLATQQDLKQLASKIEDVDRKRAADYDRLVSQIEALGKLVTAPPAAVPKARSRPAPTEEPEPAANVSDKGYYYVVKKGDYLSLIAQAYRAKNVKVTVKQILDANPGLDEKRLIVGQKIFIPAPK